MKKFMTVLLVVAVLFTFSFGSAFAAEPTLAQKVNQAKGAVLETLATNYESLLGTLADKEVSGYEIEKDAWVKAAADLQDAVEAKIEEAAAKLVADGIDNTVIGFTTELAKVGVTVAELELQLDVNAAARYQYAVDKAEFLALVEAIDLSVYSTTTPKEGKTYYEQAEAIVKEGIDKITNHATPVGETSDIATVAQAYTEMKNSFFHRFVETKADSGVYVLKADIPTITDEAADATTLAAKKAALDSAVAAKAAAYMADCAAKAKTDADFDMEAAQEQKDAYVAIHTYRIAALETVGEADAYVSRINAVADATSAVAEVEAAEALKVFAAKYKAEKDASGNVIRDAEAVDKLVEETIAKIYANLAATKAEIADLVKAAQDKIVANTIETLNADVVGLKKAAIEKNREAALKNYYELEQAAVNAKYDELVAKVEAATTDTEVGKVAEKATLTGIKTKNQVNDMYALSNGVCYKAFNDMVADLDAYASYLEALDSKLNLAAYTKDYWQTFCIEADARTAAEVTALFDTAKAELEAAQNSDEIKAEKKAVEALIKAGDVEAAKAAYDAYVDGNAPTVVAEPINLYMLQDAIEALYKADVKAVNDAVKALAKEPAKADLQAIADMVEAINEKVEEGALYEGMAEVKVPTEVTTGLEKFRAAEEKAIEDAINALPLNITLADKDAVEAVRALYDAYVAEYTDYAEGYVASDDPANIEDLFEAEAALAIEVAKLAYTVEDLKITASSSAKKGSITVKWTVKGDTSAVQGYEIWKSTKHSAGYKKAFTTTKMSYKNTKGLKKGTRYFYKVRAIAYDVDGNKVTSDWSNKARRIAK